MSGPSVAWVAAVEALGRAIPERPFPKGINRAVVGDWEITLNQSAEPADNDGVEMPPFGIQAAHQTHFVLAVLDPSGGMVGGGMTESDFIAEMEKAA